MTLAPDLAGAVAQAAVDPTLEPRELQTALRSVITTRRGCCDWTVDLAGWVVILMSPEAQEVYGRTCGVHRRKAGFHATRIRPKCLHHTTAE